MMACHFCSDITGCKLYGLTHSNTKLDDHPLSAAECLIYSQCLYQYMTAISSTRKLRTGDVVLDVRTTQFHLALTLSLIFLYDLCTNLRCLTTDTW